MIPIKNRKKSLEITVEEMRNFSLSYIEKYSPSKQQLKTYLLKKYLKKYLEKRDIEIIDEMIKLNGAIADNKENIFI